MDRITSSCDNGAVVHNPSMLENNISDDFTKEVHVPKELVGLLVGRRGLTVRKMRIKTNTYILRDDNESTETTTKYNITGPKADVETACQMIDECLASAVGQTAKVSNTIRESGPPPSSSGHIGGNGDNATNDRLRDARRFWETGGNNHGTTGTDNSSAVWKSDEDLWFIQL